LVHFGFKEQKGLLRMSSEIVIRAENLGKAYLIYQKPQDRLKQIFLRWKTFYTAYWAVQNVSFAIKRGETVGIIGRNGSGKSTLLQMIAGTLQPNSGTVVVDGRVAPLLELGSGFNPEFTGRENVRLSASILGLTSQQLVEREQAIIDFSGIGDFVDMPVKTYSSGMFARLAFSVAAHVDADVLIVDEILSVGDAAFAQKCMRFIHKFKENGTLLFVAHDPAAVSALCDRAIWMDKGQIRMDGSTKDVTFAYQAALRDELDGGGFTIKGRQKTERKPVQQDVRHKAIAESDKRNVLEVFEFDKEGPQYGKGGGEVSNVRFVDDANRTMPVVQGGEEVTLEIICKANVALGNPIVGFIVRDRLGINVFGDNTFHACHGQDYALIAGQSLKAHFKFMMPYLPPMPYSVTVALADGSMENYVQHHWLDEALIFTCANGPKRTGLIGLPMHEIGLERI
jgi:lipopolysaccharide transport system ATP-binding protein